MAIAPNTTFVSGAILTAAHEAEWGPIQFEGRLHDRASFRYFWGVLLKAQACGHPITPKVLQIIS